MELKPCPYCGGPADYGSLGGDKQNWYVWCKAQCRPDNYGSLEEAVAAWNTRLEEDGYEIIRPLTAAKGTKCGQCGMKFDHGKTYGYHCSQPGCPVFPVVTCRLDQEGKT